MLFQSEKRLEIKKNRITPTIAKETILYKIDFLDITSFTKWLIDSYHYYIAILITIKMKKLLRKIYLIILFGAFCLGLINLPYIFRSNSPDNYSPEITKSVILSSNTIFIPSLSLSAPTIFPNSADEKELQIALQNGVAHYTTTALPGTYGNSVFVGHSSDYVWAKGNYKTIFSNLPELSLGETIFISDDEQTYKYSIIETKIVDENDTTIFDQKKYERRLLTLQTSYPLGTALKRYVVVAETK